MLQGLECIIDEEAARVRVRAHARGGGGGGRLPLIDALAPTAPQALLVSTLVRNRLVRVASAFPASALAPRLEPPPRRAWPIDERKPHKALRRRPLAPHSPLLPVGRCAKLVVGECRRGQAGPGWPHRGAAAGAAAEQARLPQRRPRRKGTGGIPLTESGAPQDDEVRWLEDARRAPRGSGGYTPVAMQAGCGGRASGSSARGAGVTSGGAFQLTN